MKILYIHQYFETPDENGTTRSYWFAKRLIERGHQVTMLTSTHDATTRLAGVYNIEDIKVRYISCNYANEMPVYKKLFSFLFFMTASFFYAIKEKDVDLVFATSTPLTVGFIALLLHKIRRKRYVFEVRDLWPTFPIEIGAIKNILLIKLLKKIEKKIYKHARLIIALSPGMRDGIVEALPAAVDKTIVIPNMSKPDIFYPRENLKDIAAKFNIDLLQFNVIHFGAMGVANGLEYIIEAAKDAMKRSIHSVNFIFLGNGAVKKQLKNEVEKYLLTNVKFIDRENTYVTSEIVNCCNATITSFLNLPVLQTNSPNKLFDSLSAGKPVIVNSAGWTKKLVEEYNCGVFVDPDYPNQLVDAILDLKNDVEKQKEMGKNARDISLRIFDKEILSNKLVDELEAIL